MSVYKHFNQTNIGKALARTFSLYGGRALMNEPAVIHLTLRYFPMPGAAINFSEMYEAVKKALLASVIKGTYVQSGAGRYRKAGIKPATPTL